MQTLFNNLLTSIKLDQQLIFKTTSLNLASKLSFILSKYRLLLIYYLVKPKNIIFNWHNKKFHLDNILSIGTIQSTFIDNDFLTKYLDQNSTIIDIGANIGQFRLFCNSTIKTKNIYSFEPISATYGFLKQNFDKQVYKNAISTKHDLKFQLYDLSVWSSSVIDENNTDIKTESVIGIKPNDIAEINKLPNIDLLKIDVEGSEADALLASRDILQKSKYLIIEVFLAKTQLTNLKKIVDLVIQNCPNSKLVKIGKIYKDQNNEDAVVDIFFKLR